MGGPAVQVFALACSDARHCWVVGTGGRSLVPTADHSRIWATKDGGTTWRRQYAGTHSIVTGVACTDSRHVWVLPTDDFTVRNSNDGGRTWTRHSARTTSSLQSLAFRDTRQGWLVGSTYSGADGIILATKDGGAHWTRYKLNGRPLHDIACVRSSSR